MSETVIKVSPAQLRLLREMRDNPISPGHSSCPWGYSTAGRDASCWYRTADSLQAKGLASRVRGRAWISDAGRALLARLDQ